MKPPVEKRFDDYREKLASLNDIAALVAAQELGVFQALLAGAMTLDELAGTCGAAANRLAPMLDLVCHTGFLELAGDRYRLVPGDEHLFDPGGNYWSRLSGAHTASLFARLGKASEVVTTDQPFAAASTGGPVDEHSRDAFLRYFDAWAREPAANVAAVLCQEPFKKLMDLGCGGGTYSFAMLRRMPNAHATLLDRENAAATVDALAREAGCEQRIRFCASDLLEDSFDPDQDLIFNSNLVHCLGFAENLELVRKAADSLAPGGRLAIKDYSPPVTQEQRRTLSRFAMQLTLFSESGQLYEATEVQLWMMMCGLNHEATHDLGDSFLVIGRKQV